MNKAIKMKVIVMVVLGFLLSAGQTMAVDSPHDTFNCTDCHTSHAAPGPGLTTYASNANLCMSCHNATGLASSRPFNDAMQAVPGTGGTSHRWDATMPSVSDPNNPYGLRATADLANDALRQRVEHFEGVVTCSVCHDVHSQDNPPWDPFAPTTPGSAGRHFLRLPDDLNQLCEDCHYYRTTASGQCDVDNYTGNVLSHPVEKVFTSAQGETPDVKNPDQFNSAPLEPEHANWDPQTGQRYHLNGTSDNNTTNNLVVDASKKTRCLTCHRVHYADSDSHTVDGP